jgi:hypothetical protein
MSGFRVMADGEVPALLSSLEVKRILLEYHQYNLQSDTIVKTKGVMVESLIQRANDRPPVLVLQGDSNRNTWH